MTLPASPPISMSQIASELGLSLPLSMNHSWVLQLTGKSGLPASFSDLLGRTGKFNGNASAGGNGGSGNLFCTFGNAPFFNGQLGELDLYIGTGGGTQLTITSANTLTAKVLVTNNTTGVSIVLTRASNIAWTSALNPANLIRFGIADNFTITPSN